MTLVSRSDVLVSGLFGLRSSDAPVRGAPASVTFTQRDEASFTYFDVVIGEVSGASYYTTTLVNPSDGTILDTVQSGLTATLGPLAPVDDATKLIYQVAPDGGLATQDGVTQQPLAAAVTITTQPALVFNGGEIVGATVSVSEAQFTGGPLTGPTVYTLYTSNDDFVANRVEYAVYTGPLAVPAGWEGLKVRVEAPILGVLGTVTAISAASGTITAGTPLPVPPQPVEQDWIVTARAANAPNAATHYVLEYEWVGAGTPVTVQWLNANIDNYEVPAEYEHLWDATTLDVDKWVHYQLGVEKDRENGTVASNLRIRYKLDASGPFSLTSIDKKIGPSAPTPPPSSEAQWHTLPLVTRETVAAGLLGGSHEQRYQISLRSESDPSVIMGFQDTHGAWRSEDDGNTFFKPACEGLFAYFTTAAAIDPADDQVILFAGSNAFIDEAASRVGAFRSTDGGRTFTQTLIKTDVQRRNIRAHFIDYDRALRASQTSSTRHWWMALPNGDPTTAVPWNIYKSTDGGQTWGSAIFTTTAATHGNLNGIYHHPTQSGVLYMCTDEGLWRSTNGGTSWSSLTGNIPGWSASTTNRVVSVEINPAGGALGSTEMYICVGNYGTSNTGATGIYRSTDGGASMSALTVPGNPNRVVVAFNSSGQWPAVASRVMYLIGRSYELRRSANGGSSWTKPNANWWPSATGSAVVIWDPPSTANPQFDTCVLPHPTNPNVVWVSGNAKCFKSLDAGLNFGPSGAFFEGQQYHATISGLAFCEGNPATITGADQVATIGVTDKGWWRTQNGGQSFHYTGISYVASNGQNRRSCNLVTQCPDDIDISICTTGHVKLAPATCNYLRTDVKYPREFSSGDWDDMAFQTGFPYNGHWHRSTSTICYAHTQKFTNAKAATTKSAYSGGGYLLCVAPQNNDIIFTKTGSGASTAIRKSTDTGTSSSAFVSPGWDPGEDDRKSVAVVDPGDDNILYMPGPAQGLNKDLRRYNGTTATWKTDYGFPARFRADNPDYPSTMAAKVYWVAVDPQDRDTVAVSILAPSYCAIYITYNATDATPTWTDITKNAQRLTAAKLQFHPYNGDLWAGFSGYGGALVYPHPDAHPYPTWTANLVVQNVDDA